MKTALVRSLLLAAAIATPTVLRAAPGDAPTTAPATTSPADPSQAVIDQIRAVQLPAFDRTRQDDEAYIRSYTAQRDAAIEQIKNIELAFVRAHPDDPKAAGMAVSIVGMSGSNASTQPADAAAYQRTVDEMLALPIADKAKSAIRAMVVQRQVEMAGDDLAAATKLVDDFVAKNPTDENAGMLNFMLAQKQSDKGDQTRMRKIAADSPESRFGKMAAGTLKQADDIGKPFTLSFQDATTGKPIDVQRDYKGKVVVVDFWATWCGPCVAEMPNMKKLYAEYHDKGVEFIGVSLDQPGDGLEKLKKFVADNQIPWPQYYQGNGWDSDFSKSWGINAIPCVFVVGKDGNLLTAQGRGEETLRKIFDQQLAK